MHGFGPDYLFLSSRNFFRSNRTVKGLLTLWVHPPRVFLEDTPPLPNALGPGSLPASFFFVGRGGRPLSPDNFPLGLAAGTR